MLFRYTCSLSKQTQNATKREQNNFYQENSLLLLFSLMLLEGLYNRYISYESFLLMIFSCIQD